MARVEGYTAEGEPEGLYEKYRVFREPLRDSQGNPPDEHPVSLDPPVWLTKVPGVAAPGTDPFQIVEPLVEVTAFTFVLKPDSDRHARVAIAAYAWSVRDDDPALAQDLLDMLVEE